MVEKIAVIVLASPVLLDLMAQARELFHTTPPRLPDNPATSQGRLR